VDAVLDVKVIHANVMIVVHVNVIANHVLVRIRRILYLFIFFFVFLIDENTSCGSACSCTDCNCSACDCAV
jgi:hypothetical protein